MLFLSEGQAVGGHVTSSQDMIPAPPLHHLSCLHKRPFESGAKRICASGAMQVCFSEGGERFAAIGQGGLAAAWRLDAPQFTQSDSGPLARSDWCHQVTEFSAVRA